MLKDGIAAPQKTAARKVLIAHHGHASRYLILAAFLMLLMPALALSEVSYDSNKKLLTVKSEGSMMSAVLSEVSGATGIDVYINPAADKKVFADIKDAPLEQAIKRLIKPLNNAFVYEGKTVKAVKIFEKSEKEASSKLSAGKGGAGAAAGKKMPTKAEFKAGIREKQRQAAIARGQLREFEEKEAMKEKRDKEHKEKAAKARERFEKHRAERAKRREAMKAGAAMPGQPGSVAPQ